jgi:hypothetical protein
MYAVVRSYSGSGARELFDLLEERKTDVEGRIATVAGFVSYTLIRTDGGGISETVCQDEEGTDQSTQVARDWISANAANLNADPPAVSEGSVIMHLA